MKFREFLLNEDNVKYAVIRLGGSIGEKPYTVNQRDVYDNKEDAKEDAKRSNKLLSPGEKKYYGIKYTVIELTQKNIQKYNLKVDLNEEYDLNEAINEEKLFWDIYELLANSGWSKKYFKKSEEYFESNKKFLFIDDKISDRDRVAYEMMLPQVYGIYVNNIFPEEVGKALTSWLGDNSSKRDIDELMNFLKKHDLKKYLSVSLRV